MIELEIVTPDRLVFSEPVDEAVFPGVEGYFGVLEGHAPMLTQLGIGEIEYRKGGRPGWLAVSGGFVEVLRSRVSVMAENCERAEEIDRDRALEQKRLAEEILREGDASESRFRQAEVRLKKALARLQASSRVGGE